MDILAQIQAMSQAARKAARLLAHAAPASKNMFMEKLALCLAAREKEILLENEADIIAARQNGMDAAKLDRLRLTPAIMEEMRAACRHVASLPDPVGATESQWQRPNGLLVGKMRIPLGVVAMIYESRPNVTIDSAILCVKAGNAIILRGGREALRSNLALAACLRQALADAGLPQDCCQLVPFVDHEAVNMLCRMEDYIDVVIPRGGESLIRAVCETATVPVLRHYRGVCHVYVDKGADTGMACDIIANSKAQRPGVCNAMECLLVHRDAAVSLLPALAQRLDPYGVEFRACPASLPLLGPHARPLRNGDLGMEFHALIMAVRIVASFEEALDHIDRYGSRHTEVICSRDYSRCMRFLREVDASMVGVNASTRFNDGGQLGLGAEIGISTSKLHAYGPMGVKELTTTKFVVLGEGQVRN